MRFSVVGYVNDEESYHNLVKEGRDLRRWPLEVIVLINPKPCCYCTSCGDIIEFTEIDMHLSKISAEQTSLEEFK